MKLSCVESLLLTRCIPLIGNLASTALLVNLLTLNPRRISTDLSSNIKLYYQLSLRVSAGYTRLYSCNLIWSFTEHGLIGPFAQPNNF